LTLATLSIATHLSPISRARDELRCFGFGDGGVLLEVNCKVKIENENRAETTTDDKVETLTIKRKKVNYCVVSEEITTRTKI